MTYLYFVFFFVLGTVLGSFYNVVGWRLPIGESIISPPSHCPKCNHRLKAGELIPIISYIIQGGKCKNCKEKISCYYPIFEFISGLLFGLSYLSFGLTLDLVVALTFISMLLIIIVSDIHYMIICDEVLIVFSILLAVEIGIIYGPTILLSHMLSGVGSFLCMYLLKKIGDFIFKQESMGGGDIKLMFILGLVLELPMALLSIFVGSLVGLPISLIFLKKNSEHIIPFGPYLAIGAITLLLLHVDTTILINLLGH